MTPFDYLIACGRELKNIIHVVFRLWINDQIIFRVITLEGNIFTGSYKTTHFSYNVKTRQPTKIEDIDVGYIEVWLHTNSLFLLPNTPT
jgi:hypothetical protein